MSIYIKANSAIDMDVAVISIFIVNGDLKIQLCHTNSGAPCIAFKNGDKVVFDWEELASKAIDMYNDEVRRAPTFEQLKLNI